MIQAVGHQIFAKREPHGGVRPVTLGRQEAAPATQGHPRIRILIRSTHIKREARIMQREARRM